MPPPNRVDLNEWREVNEWAREQILRTVRVATLAAGGCSAAWLSGRIATGFGKPPTGFYGLNLDRRRQLVCEQIERLLDERRLEKFSRREVAVGNYFMCLRLSNVLDQMLYAMDQEEP